MIRKVARPMLASVYIADGADTLINAQDHAEGAESVLKRVRTVLPRRYARQLPNDGELVARVVGGAKVGAGGLLALGKMPRTSAAVLAATSVPTILARHAFWETQDQDERKARRSGFITNVALLGGLFITTADTAGKPGMKWRATKAAEVANKKVQHALPTKSETEKFTDSARDFFGDASEKVSEYAHKAQDYVADNKDDWIDTATSYRDNWIDSATTAATKVTDYVSDNKDDWLDTAQDNAKAARKGVVKAASKAQKRADDALETAEKKSGRGAKKAKKNAEKMQSEADKALKKAKKKVGDLV